MDDNEKKTQRSFRSAELAIESAKNNNHRRLKVFELRLEKLPETLGELTQLTELDLSGNKLRELPDVFGKLSKLTRLELRGNELSELPPSIGSLKQLTHLDVSGNELRSLPDTLSNLSQLTELYLKDCDLCEFPSIIGNYTQLTKLKLSSNKLRELPDVFDKLSQLTELKLEGNELCELPRSIGSLSQLTSLSLGCNPLVKLPDSMKNLKQITFCSLEGVPNLPHRLQVNELKSAIRYLQRHDMESEWENSVGLENQFLENPKNSKLGLAETLLCTVMACGFLATTSDPLLWFIWASTALFLLLRSEFSTSIGLNWFGFIIKKLHIKDYKYNEINNATYLLRLLIAGLLAIPIKFAATFVATLRRPITTLFSIPDNLQYQTLRIDLSTPPELIPGSEKRFAEQPEMVLVRYDLRYDLSKGDDLVSKDIFIYSSLNKKLNFNNFFLGLFLFLSWSYRWLIKSTALIYWPLYLIKPFSDKTDHDSIHNIAVDYDKDLLKFAISGVLILISTGIINQWLAVYQITSNINLFIEQQFPFAQAIIADFNSAQFINDYVPWLGVTPLKIGFILLAATFFINITYLSGKVTKLWDHYKKKKLTYQGVYIKAFKVSLILQYICAVILTWFGFEFVSRVGVHLLMQ